MSFLLAHLTDTHIGPLPRPTLRELVGKRITGYVNWKRGRHRTHDMEQLARIVADIRAQRPDHVAMTGDVLNIGLAAEFAPALAWLETLGADEDVSFTPGNHDAYAADTMALLSRTFARHARPDGSRAREAVYPYLRVRGPIALIGLNSGLPTAPFMATGRLGARQRGDFAAILEDAGARGLARVVMIHHPPLASGAATSRRLGDAPEFEAIVRRFGAELVLHGHNHTRSVAHVLSRAARTAGGRIAVVGAPSASSIMREPSRYRAAYHLFRIVLSDGLWKVTARARGPVDGGEDIGDLGAIDVLRDTRTR